MAFDPVTAALEVGNKLIDHWWPDATKAAEARQKLEELHQSGVLAQLTADTQLAQAQTKINEIEAASTNMFIAGWRPAVGWICGTGLLYAAVVNPIGQFLAMTYFSYKGPFPVLDTGTLVSVLVGMLGLGGMRTFEKLKGAEGNR